MAAGDSFATFTPLRNQIATQVSEVPFLQQNSELLCLRAASVIRSAEMSRNTQG